MKGKDGSRRLPFAFLHRFLSVDEYAEVDNCFEEMAARVEAEKGRSYARRWILWQALKSLPGFAFHWIYWRLVMMKNALEITGRNLRKSRWLFLVKVFGLASGLACAMVVILYVANELTYDTHHPDHRRVFRIANRFASSIGEFTRVSTPGPLAPAIRRMLPQAEEAARVIPPFENAGHVLVTRGEARFFEKRVWFVDDAIFRILRLPFREGSPRTALAAPNTVVLSETAAQRYFGNRPPLGRSLSVEIDYDTGASVIEDFQVTGVVEDPPANTHLKYDLLLSMPTLQAHVPDLDQNWGEYHSKYTYVKLGRNVSPSAFTRQLRLFSEPVQAEFLKRAGFRMQSYENFLQPVASLHMNSTFLEEIDPPGNPYYLYIYSFAALLILLIGSVNFVNLSAAFSTGRSREVGIRKTLGADRWDLIFQFLGESLLITFLAFLAAMVLLALLLGYFNRMAGTELGLRALRQPAVLGSLLALFLAVGVCAGAYPALLLSRFRPARILRDRAVTGRQGGRGQRLLVFGQFAVCIFLVVCTLVVFRQLTFMKGRALGFSREQKLVLEVKSNQAHFRNDLEAVKADFLKIPGIRGAAASSGVPGEPLRGVYNLQRGERFSGAGSKKLRVLTVDSDFLPLFEIAMAAGRPFRKTGGNDAASAYIVNPAGARQLGLTPESVLGTRWTAHYHRKTKSVVGVTADFHFLGMKESAEPMVLDLENSLLQYLILSLDARRLGPVLEGVKRAWRHHFPGVPFEYEFLDQAFGRVYQYEERMGKLLGVISMMGISIALLGLFGLVSFYARARRKEIGVRKVLGASAASVALLMTRQFVSLVFLAGLASVPLAWAAASRWLQDFAFHIEPGLPVFAFAFFSALAIALFAVLLQSLRAARDNPVDALRCE